MTSVSVVGGGPVGLMMACLLAPFYHVVVYEKRNSYNRIHELEIGGEVIDELINYCGNSVSLTKLSSALTKFKNSSITTMIVEQELRVILAGLGVNVIKQCVTDPSKLKTSIVIACDGAHSTIRGALHQNLSRDLTYTDPELVDQHQWGYLLAMRFTTSLNTTPRKLISGLVYNIPSAMNGLGLDHESFHATAPDDTTRKVSLYLPISQDLYEMLEGRSWTIDSLKTLGNSVNVLVNHLGRYEVNLNLRKGQLLNETIKVLPLIGFRASSVSYISKSNTVFLVGDSASALIYRQGLKSGWMQACYLATQLMDVRASSSFSPSSSAHSNNLEEVAQNYQSFCVDLYQRKSESIQQTAQYKESINSSLALAGIGIMSLAAVGLALLLKR